MPVYNEDHVRVSKEGSRSINDASGFPLELINKYFPPTATKYRDMLISGQTIGQIKRAVLNDAGLVTWKKDSQGSSTILLINGANYKYDYIASSDNKKRSHEEALNYFLKPGFAESAIEGVDSGSDDHDKAEKNVVKYFLNILNGLDNIAQSVFDVAEAESDLEELRARAKRENISLEELLFKIQWQLFGDFTPVIDFQGTSAKVLEWLQKHTRPNNPPPIVRPYEMRIGGSKFLVPPTSIIVQTSFQSGSLSGAALRQTTPPRFNSGHSETIVTLELYFPNDGEIWGFDDNEISINFGKDGDSDEKIDRYLSSLRGLISQFKYAPFLPIENEYLNRVYGIDAVALQGMNIETIPNFPFCIKVQLTLLKFNYDVYLPMVASFDKAIHWGRFREYMGRAAKRLSDYASKDFLTNNNKDEDTVNKDINKSVEALRESEDLVEELPEIYTFNKTYELGEGTNFDFYYIDKDPIFIVGPDLNGFVTATDTQSSSLQSNHRQWWESLLGSIGIDYADNPEARFDTIAVLAKEITGGAQTNTNSVLRQEAFLLIAWMNRIKLIVNQMGPGKRQEYIDRRIKEMEGNGGPLDSSAKKEVTEKITSLWYAVMFNKFSEDPYIQAVLQYQQRIAGWIAVREWDVPMRQMKLDQRNIHVQSVTVSMANSIAKLQLSMQNEPVYQHMGGMGSSIVINMIVTGEEELLRLRRLFETVNSMARLEHAHAVLGFLGIKNVLTALCGIKYVVPQAFEVQTVKGYPHVYNVMMQLLDFDIFQTRREMLNTEQQAELMEMFTKRNPFLRLQQAWGAFSGYPDFPLEIRDKKGNITGHLDPDYYFNSFQIIDDDVVDFINDVKTRLTEEQRNDVKDAIGKLEKQITNDAAAAANIDASLQEYKRILKADDAISADDGNHVPFMSDYRTKHFLGALDKDGKMQSVVTSGDGVSPNSVYEGLSSAQIKRAKEKELKGAISQFNDPLLGEFFRFNEAHAGNMLGNPAINGLAPPEKYSQPHANNIDDPFDHFREVFRDTQYRNKSGRMVRAFPSYMLWLIDEGGISFGVKLYDNFYGLQSVIDFSTVDSEDVMGSTLVLRLSNLSKRLSTPDQTQINEGLYANAAIINKQANISRNILSGTSDYLVKLETIDLRPGIRLHLRCGYGGNPNVMDTIFNGVITQVQQGEIITVTAQSDAIELGAVVNNKDKDGSSGKIDGGLFTGLWMSEPRDLMVRLLSMGSSVFREQIAHATKGKIFSETRFGIRHFGSILYDTMSENESKLQTKRQQGLHAVMESALSDRPGNGFSFGNLAGGLDGQIDFGIMNLISRLWANSVSKRDFELFKRNIYPGNGTGIAQYLGGDIGDGGPGQAFFNGGVSAEGDYIHPVTGEDISNNELDVVLALNQNIKAANQVEGDTGTQSLSSTGRNTLVGLGVAGPAGGIAGLAAGGIAGIATGFIPGWGDATHKMAALLGLSRAGDVDNDIQGFNEVAFRAQTYMKSVWDLFLLCAALLPNYIVAVRPFMERSTVFYGKPHWMYTSGVIPLSTGLTDQYAPKPVDPDAELELILKQIETQKRSKEDQYDLYRKLSGISAGSTEEGSENQGGQPSGNSSTDVSVDPDKSSTNTGSPSDVKLDASYANSLPTVHPTREGVVLPFKKGKFGPELHIGTSGDLATDIKQHHNNAPWVAAQYRHPFYMDRVGGSAGGYAKLRDYDPAKGNNQTILGASAKAPNGDDFNSPGKGGAFGILHPDDEEYYIAVKWTYNNHKDNYQKPSDGPGNGAKILVYNPTNQKGVVVTPGDWGPADWVEGSNGIAGGLSVEAFYYLSPTGVKDQDLTLGFVDDSIPVGPYTGLAPKVSVPENQGGTVSAPPETAVAPTSANQINENTPSLSSGLLPKFMYSKPVAEVNATLGGIADPFLFAAKFGWFIATVPPTFTDPSSGRVDLVGKTASTIWQKRDKDSQMSILKAGTATAAGIYGGPIGWGVAAALTMGPLFSYSGRTDTDAERIWYEFRLHFPLDETNIKTWNSHDDFGSKYPVARGDDDKEKYQAMLVDFAIFAAQTFKKKSTTNKNTGLQETEQATDEELRKAGLSLSNKYSEDPEYKYMEVMMTFMQFMWGHPYHRGWLVLTADAEFDVVRGLFKDVTTFVEHLPVLGDLLGDNLGWLDDVGEFAGDIVDTVGGVINAGYNFLAGNKQDKEDLDNEFTAAEARQWNFDRAHNLFSVYIGQGRDAAITWMIEHSSAGENYSGPLRIAEEIKERVWDPLSSMVGDIFKGLGTAFTGIVNLIRYGMQSMSYGFGMAGVVQQQANMLNQMLNDSIYYQGVPGTLQFLVDNPFTREYAEPVVEIREPFQRMHMLNSYQHILNNGIIEVSGTPTVVTAVSNQKHPVTVYFDKGASTERQVEKTVETGLWWDSPSALGSIIHPISAIRGWKKSWAGNSDELSSKRVALWHLKESLKDIYDGEIVILGDPNIRAHDLIYIDDVYERMYGMFEVEQVVHHFTPETGFITSITPNALVMINDPGKWSTMAVLRNAWGAQSLRNLMRRTFGSNAKNRGLTALPADIELKDLEKMFESHVSNIQYTGGASALILDLVDSASLGGMNAQRAPYDPLGLNIGPGLTTPSGASVDIFSAMGAWLRWPAFNWVKDKLEDQHGCYIQYLTKGGLPMDAGLSYNHGVAVGQQESASLFGNALRIPIGKRITSNMVMSNIGWNPDQIAAATEDLSYFQNKTRAMIIESVGGQGTNGLPAESIPFLPPVVHTVTIIKVIDGDTFVVAEKDIVPISVRLAYVNTPEVGHPIPASDILLDARNLGVQATEFAIKRLIIDPQNQFDEFNLQQKVVIRIDPSTPKDSSGRTIAWVFHNAPSATTPEQRIELLTEYASGWPDIKWNQFLPTGQPYTFNWELVVYGYAQVDDRLFNSSNINAVDGTGGR